jgi:alpha-tubulin suppressor-like RCC1 family protein
MPFLPALPTYSGIWTRQQHMQNVAASQWTTPGPILYGWGRAETPGYGSRLLGFDNLAQASPKQISMNNWIQISGQQDCGAGIQTTTPFKAWSARFPGATTSYLTLNSIATTTNLTSTNTYTIEMWVHPLAYPTSTNLCSLFQISNVNATNFGNLNLSFYGSGQVQFDLRPSTGGTNVNTISNATTGLLILRTWNHIALVVNSGAATIYINGSSAATSTVSSLDNTQTFCSIGYINNGYTTSQTCFNGYISNVRVVKDVAVYTGTFAPSFTPLETSQAAGTNIAAVTDSQTVLLTAQLAKIVDSSSSSIAITTVGHIMSTTEVINPTFARNYNYALYTWGDNTYGQLGDGTVISRSSPVQIPGDKWQSVVASQYHMLAIKTDGTLWAWGRANFSQLGENSFINRSSPTQITKFSNWLQLAAGRYSSLAIKTDGTLWGWGGNASGTLGNLAAATVYVPTVQGALTTWKTISTNVLTTIAIKSDGTLWTWGLNSSGQLGNSALTNRSSPGQVGLLTTWSNVWSAGGGATTIGIKTDGTLNGWGGNGFGQLGSTAAVSTSSPNVLGALTNWLSIAGGGYTTTTAIKNDGTLWTWGYGLAGSLGNINTSIPSGTTFSSIVPAPFSNTSSPNQVGTSNTWIYATSIFRNTYAISGYNVPQNTWTAPAATSTSVWGVGQFSNLTTAATLSSPVQVASSSSTWSSLSGGVFTTSFCYGLVKSDGTLWTWGTNVYGQLGLINTLDRSSPGQVGLLTNWSKVFSGGLIMAAIKTDGSLWTWGYSDTGALGDSTAASSAGRRSSPVKVGTDTNWQSLSFSSGAVHCLGVRTNGTLWSWGLNTYGQLANNTVGNASSPIQIGALTNWLQAAAGYNFSLAIKSDGTLWAWGYNTTGELGLNDVVNRSSPVQVGVRRGWTKVITTTGAGAGTGTCAAINNGQLFTWGRNTGSGLADFGTVTNNSSPNAIGSASNWVDIAAYPNLGTVHGIQSDGTLWGWGTNGLPGFGAASSPVQIGTDKNWVSFFSSSTSNFAIRKNAPYL